MAPDRDDGSTAASAADVATSSTARRWTGLRHATPFVAVAMVASLVSSTVALAAAQATFSDVPPEHPFFVPIQSMSDNCIAGGYEDGTFRPAASVTRQAMAAFLSRTASRAFWGLPVGPSNPTFGSVASHTTSSYVTIAEVVVTTPDLPGNCMVPVVVTGHATLQTNKLRTDACHDVNFCQVQLRLVHSGSSDLAYSFRSGRLSADYASLPISTTAVASQPDGTTRTYSLQMSGFNVKVGGGQASSVRNITAVTHPIGGTGV